MRPLSLLGLGSGLRGGIRPPEHKDISLSAPPVRLQTDIFHIPYRSRNGHLHRMVIHPGDEVLKGQLLNMPKNADDRQIRSPDSGKIVEEKEILISGRIPYHSPALILHSDGQHTAEKLPAGPEWKKCDSEELMRRIVRAGVYGMGGGGFPTIIKLRVSKHIDTLIVNAAECEPYITADHCLLERKSDELINGIRVLCKILQPKQTIIGIEKNMTSAIEAVRSSLATNSSQEFTDRIQLQEVEAIYPTGGERQLISVLMGKDVPKNKLPSSIGVLCLNVATICAIWRAVAFNEILTERMVTISGDAAENPRNYWVPLWMPVAALLDASGETNWREKQLLMGGAMMNYPVRDTSMPVTPGTNCFLLMSPKRRSIAAPTHRECISCGLCEQVCPVRLQPQFLYRLIKADQLEEAEHYHLADCIECAACDYVCPSKIPLSDYYMFAKEELNFEKKRQIQADRARERFTHHKQRIEEDAKALERRRQERRQRLMNATKPEAPADEKQARERKIAMLKVQATKTEEAIAKWEAKGDTEKITALQLALKGLQTELKSLQADTLE